MPQPATSLRECLALLDAYAVPLASCAHRIEIADNLGRWTVALTLDPCSATNAIIRSLGVLHVPQRAYEDEFYAYRVHAGMKGRVWLVVTVKAHKVRRVNGMTGAGETVPGLW